MERGERASVVYGMAADTPAKYITFVTKNGLIKRTSLEDFGKIRKKTPTNAITLREGDNIAAAFLANDEDVIILTEAGWGIRFSLGGITSTGKTSQGVKGINVGEGDKVVTALPIRDINDSLAIFYTDGSGYKITLDLVNSQNRGGRGVSYISKGSKLAAAALVEDADTVLIAGTATSLCISAKDIPLMLTRGSRGSVLINGSGILSASKI
jgi:DNA gyrase subunit A